MELNQAIEVLRAYSLVQRDPNTGALSIHRLVQAVLRDAMPAEETKLLGERAVLAVNTAFPDPEFAQWSICERYLPHAQACAKLIERGNLVLLATALFPNLTVTILLNKAGQYLHERARYTEAEPLYKYALAIYERQLGPQHSLTANTLTNLASLYHNQGKHGEAKSLYKCALAIYEQQLGAEHPNTACCLNNLAMLYKNQRKYEQAEPLLLRALAICEQQLGQEHPSTATNLNNLASFYQSQGKYEQAEPWSVRALAIHEKILGASHPHTAISLNNLAELYRAQSKYAQAESLYHCAHVA